MLPWPPPLLGPAGAAITGGKDAITQPLILIGHHSTGDATNSMRCFFFVRVDFYSLSLNALLGCCFVT